MLPLPALRSPSQVASAERVGIVLPTFLAETAGSPGLWISLRNRHQGGPLVPETAETAAFLASTPHTVPITYQPARDLGRRSGSRAAQGRRLRRGVGTAEVDDREFLAAEGADDVDLGAAAVLQDQLVRAPDGDLLCGGQRSAAAPGPVGEQPHRPPGFVEDNLVAPQQLAAEVGLCHHSDPLGIAVFPPGESVGGVRLIGHPSGDLRPGWLFWLGNIRRARRWEPISPDCAQVRPSDRKSLLALA